MLAAQMQGRPARDKQLSEAHLFQVRSYNERLTNALPATKR